MQCSMASMARAGRVAVRELLVAGDGAAAWTAAGFRCCDVVGDQATVQAGALRIRLLDAWRGAAQRGAVGWGLEGAQGAGAQGAGAQGAGA